MDQPLFRAFRRTIPILVALLGPAARAEAPAPAFTAPTTIVVGISPFLGRDVKDEVYRRLVGLLVQDLPVGSSLAMFDAYHLRTIAQVDIPTARPFQNERTRVNQFQGAIRQLRLFLAGASDGSNGESAPVAAALRIPQFLEFVRENQWRSNAAVAVLLLGGPLYVDPREPSLSMVEGYCPSDGHLLASREQSVYGLKELTNTLPGLAVHFGYFGEPWINELHRERIQRFWGLYFQQQGGFLGAFSPDLATVFKAVRLPRSELHPAPYTIDQGQTRLAMVRLSRNLSPSDWITRDTLPSVENAAPPTMVGPMKIGIRWRGPIDLDLYAKPRRSGETLFFDHARSPDGYFYKDHRASPDKDYEFIEFETPVDIGEVDAAVNFYAGAVSSPVMGEVRVEFAGRIYGGVFGIAARHGNEGRSGPSQKEYWAELDLRRLLKVDVSRDAGARETK